jgi:Sulfotransferase family
MVKQLIGKAAALVNPQCRFDKAIFILGHMRCGSTAMSHILCSRPEISGYGEAHIRYDHASALGALVLNQARRDRWKPKGEHLFDKILHSRYDSNVSRDFATSRAIFMVREPVETIRSIRTLFAAIGSGEYADDSEAADYYEERIAALADLWRRFPPDRRIGMTYDELTGDPETMLARVSSMLLLMPPLENSYEPPSKRMDHGAGDPISSHKFNSIVPTRQSDARRAKQPDLDLPHERINSLHARFQSIRDLFLESWPGSSVAISSSITAVCD